jgi:hypothetical protein
MRGSVFCSDDDDEADENLRPWCGDDRTMFVVSSIHRKPGDNEETLVSCEEEAEEYG